MWVQTGRSPRCLVDERVEAVASKGDEDVVQDGFSARIGGLVLVSNAFAILLTAARTVVRQQLMQDQGFQIHHFSLAVLFRD